MVSDDSPAVNGTANALETLAEDVSALEIKQEIKEEVQHENPQPLPPHLSHDPQYNQKRSDPFQFGSRFLQQEDDVFEFNAWDHVETDDVYKEYSEQQYALQRQSPVSDWDKRTCLFPFFASSTTIDAGVCDDLLHKHSSSEHP